MEGGNLEKFLELHNLSIYDFIFFMDKSQIKYDNIGDFIKKVKPCDWIIRAFSWNINKIPSYITENSWKELNVNWNNYLSNYPMDKIYFYKKSIKNKLKVHFE